MYIHTRGVVASPEFVRRALSGSTGPAWTRIKKERGKKKSGFGGLVSAPLANLIDPFIYEWFSSCISR